MSVEEKKLLEIRKTQLASMSEMVDSLRDENQQLKKDNKLMSGRRTELLG